MDVRMVAFVMKRGKPTEILHRNVELFGESGIDLAAGLI